MVEIIKKIMTHRLIGGIFLFVGAMITTALVIIYYQGDSITTQITVNNVNPNIDSIYFSTNSYGGVNDFAGGINLVAGSDKAVHVNGIVSDANGAQDIDVIALTMFRSSLADPQCTGDFNDCYHVDSCSTQQNDNTSKKFDCNIALKFFADATDPTGHYPDDNWVANVRVQDLNTGNDTNTASVEVNTLLAANISGFINYGTLTSNSQTTNANNQTMTITQQGNCQLDIQISMAAAQMNCTGTGNIPRSNQKWALTDVGYADSASTALTDTATDTDLHLDYRINDSTPKTIDLFWNIAIPYGVVGTCIGSITITAIAQ